MKSKKTLLVPQELSIKTQDIDKSNYPEYIEKIFEFKIPAGQQPERIDKYLTRSVVNATRNRVQKAIDEDQVTINGKVAKPSKKILPNDLIICKILKSPPISLIPENIPLNIIYEDESIIVINKQAGLVTHPAPGNRYGTLVNAVLYHIGLREAINLEFDEDDEPDESLIFSSDEIRPGIVHRLDKDTSGLLVVSKNPVAHAKLSKQFADRTVKKKYYALVWGNPKQSKGRIIADIGRSSRDRKLFTVLKKGGKFADTEYKVIESFEYFSLLEILLHTGRTHQIRVHLSHESMPIVGDTFYGGNSLVYGGNNPQFRIIGEKVLKLAARQMLHAKTLSLHHPVSGQELTFDSNIPEDMQIIIDYLRIISSTQNSDL
ncbi:MAG: RluA family pseudouridine synthase [Candidatus Kapabacteria bacterium]|nr:RluA family pseudouridine synthase [Candidatus Kapabacteria bacterium]